VRVLLVDDSDAVRLTLAAILEDAGHDVVEAHSVATGRMRLDASFDLVVLDHQLGDGFGSALIPEVRAAAPAATVIVLSGGHVDPRPDADEVLLKGNDPDLLVQHMEGVVARRAAAR
jgi:DNA-binding response OmpR family regulator